jgi:hypothetical protein
MCYVLLETILLRMWTTICLEPINGCVEPIICDTSCICDQCMSFFLVLKYLCYITDEFFCLVVIFVVVISNICLVHA